MAYLSSCPNFGRPLGGFSLFWFLTCFCIAFFKDVDNELAWSLGHCLHNTISRMASVLFFWSLSHFRWKRFRFWIVQQWLSTGASFHFRRLGFGKMLIIQIAWGCRRTRRRLQPHNDSTLFDHQAGVTAVDILQFEGEFSLQPQIFDKFSVADLIDISIWLPSA
jgi:hypothetical protein